MDLDDARGQAGKKSVPHLWKPTEGMGSFEPPAGITLQGLPRASLCWSLGPLSLILLSSPLRCCGPVNKTPKGEVHTWNPSEVTKIWATKHFPQIIEGQRTRVISWQPRPIEIISGAWGCCINVKTLLKSDSMATPCTGATEQDTFAMSATLQGL